MSIKKNPAFAGFFVYRHTLCHPPIFTPSFMPIGKQLSLKRDLGPISGYATIIGILVGAGIFRMVLE